MNHGYCKSCWWWKEYYPSWGKCYMHNSNEGWVGNNLEIIGEPKLIKEITEE